MRRESIKRLLVRAPNWLGDAVMCEPALRGLRALFPASEITVLAKPLVAELFLAYRGFKVANISMVPSAGLPPELEKHRSQNVVAFTVEPQKLAEIRKRRFADWKIEESPYEDLQSVVREVQEAERIYGEKGWPVINTTGLAVEETSTLCLSALRLKPRLAPV